MKKKDAENLMDIDVDVDVPVDEDDEYGFEFDEKTSNDSKKIRHGRRSDSKIHIAIIAVILLVVVAVIVRIVIWNRGTEVVSDPFDIEDFDVEPSDYIQPLSGEQMAGKVDDGVNTILLLGNSPFADNYPDNNLAKALSETMDANVVNAAIPGSYLTQKYVTCTEDCSCDGISLCEVSKALATGEYDNVIRAASLTSPEAETVANTLPNIDMSSVDCIMIMYDIEDYVDHRPLADDNDEYSPTSVFGAVSTSIKTIQEKYPYIRIVFVSTPCCGKTIDNFFVDGEEFDLGYGTLTEYMTMELTAVTNVGASFVDIYYGAVNIENRDKYLYDDYHINDDGAKAIATRIAKLIKL